MEKLTPNPQTMDRRSENKATIYTPKIIVFVQAINKTPLRISILASLLFVVR